MTDDYLPVALDKRIAQARERLTAPGQYDSPWTLQLLGYLADEAEAAHSHINTDAAFGVGYLVRIQYNTDFDGREIDPAKEEYPETLHGPFDTEAQAVAWMEAYPEDTDRHDMFVIVMNRVRPV